jgi:4-hydroxyphenylacetate 3-monooxygenase
MPARTGAQFLRGLKDDRELWLGGERITDAATHPALRGAAHSIAAVFDLQHERADVCLMPDPETAEPINVSHMIPQSREDLERRHAGLRAIAEYTVGLMGRTPDYVNVTYAGFAGCHDEWSHSGNEHGAENLIRYQKYMARADLSLTHAIIHPTTDRARGAVPLGVDNVSLHKVCDTEHGIVVRGARVLATLAPFADDVAVYPAAPMPDANPAHALSFSIPMATPGLKFLCRDSVSVPGTLFDNPFSSRFDEQDAFVIFDNVEIPRDRVFIDGNLPVYNGILRSSWWPNIMQQAMIRAETKLTFAWGIASRMAEAINASLPPAVQMLGEIWTFAQFARSSLRAAEVDAHEYGNGAWFPAVEPLIALRASLPRWFPRVNEIIRELGSHNLLTTPTAAQFANPVLRPVLDEMLGGVGDIGAEERARIFRLAWDFAGSGLASRNEQYERFYLGSGPRNLMHAHQRGDRKRADRLVDRFLSET